MNSEIREIFLYFKSDNQKLKCIEELSELIRAISRDDRKNIIEEIADVEILIMQIKMAYYINKKEVIEIKKKKIEKVLFRVRNKK